jgi:hypothetical protein
MTADVYAGDEALRDGAALEGLTATAYTYVIIADPDADVLSRIANQFNFANVAPWGRIRRALNASRRVHE